MTEPLSSERDALVRRVVLAVAGAYAVVVAGASILRYEAFASDFDHGIFSQYVWLLGTFRDPFNTVNLRFLLGDHVEPGLVLLAPLGTLGVGAIGLLVVQAIALAATAPVLYALARARGASGWVAAIGPVLWCLSPVVFHAALHDFHPETLFPVLLVAGVLALERERTGWFIVSAILACSLKEDIALTYGALGLVLVWTGRRRLGGWLAAAATAWAVIAVTVVLPAFGNAATQEYGPRFAGDRGGSFADAFRFIVVHPLTSVDSAINPTTIGIATMVVAITGGLCLIAPRWLLVAVPSVALNVFSRYDLQHTIQYHYWIVPAGTVALAGALGAGAVQPADARRWIRIALVTACVGGALTAQWFSAISRQIRYEWPQRADRLAVLAAIPDNARVSAPMHALSHLSERRWLFVLPEPLLPVRVGTEWGAQDRAEATDELDFIVVDPAMKTWGAPTEAEIEAAIEQSGFREVMRRGGTRLFKRETAP